MESNRYMLFISRALKIENILSVFTCPVVIVTQHEVKSYAFRRQRPVAENGNKLLVLFDLSVVGKISHHKERVYKRLFAEKDFQHFMIRGQKSIKKSCKPHFYRLFCDVSKNRLRAAW
jgi:hypothetical protein